MNTKADLDTIKANLKAAPEKPRPLKLSEVLAALKPEIAALRSRGYSFNEIVEGKTI